MVILFFLALIINISIMLEKNFLYRRMQNRDIFRAFSRTYSRQHHQRSQRNNPHNTTADPLQYTSNIQSSFRIIEEDRSFTASHNPRRDPHHATTAPLYVKTEQTSHKCMPFSQTVNLNALNSQFSRSSSCKKQPYDRSIISKRKQSDSLLVNIHGRNKREHFKLKSCVQRQNQQFDGPNDETQFSLLELERRNALKKGWDKKSVAGIFKIDKKYDARKMTPQVGKRVAAHVFSKYACIISPKQIQNVPQSCQIE